MPWSHMSTAWESRSAPTWLSLTVGPKTGSQTGRLSQERGHHTATRVEGGSCRVAWAGCGQGPPRTVAHAQSSELQQDWPSQRWGSAPALCSKARGRAGGQKGQEAVSWLIGTISPPPISLV